MDSSKATPPPQEAKLHFLDYWRIIRIRKTVILAVFLLVVITATLVTFILPEWYSSTARILVYRDQSDIPEIGGEGLQAPTIPISSRPNSKSSARRRSWPGHRSAGFAAGLGQAIWPW